MLGSRHLLFPATLALVAGLALAGCQKKVAGLESADGLTTASVGQPDKKMTGSFKQTEEFAKAWNKDKTNVKAGFAYADSLARLGQAKGQADVLKDLAANNPNDAGVQSIAGRRLLSMGAAADAVPMLERATQLNPKDWLAVSAWGSALDQTTQHVAAREKYEMALRIRPGEPLIRNNIAMSYALQGKLPESEKILKGLLKDGAGKAMPRIRQNLALVVGLQGRFDEAKKIASEDLPPDQVEANLAYLKQMLAQNNTWAQLSDQ